MNNRTRSWLLMQGFCPQDVDHEPEIGRLARWTPFSCAAFGTAGLAAGLLPLGLTLCPCSFLTLAGLWMGSGWFFVGLGLLTLTGGLTSHSIYDRLYNLMFRHLFHTSAIPEHGAPRRFGCALGGSFYITSGAGFLLGHIWMAFIPAGFMVFFATLAGFTQWCFASALYGWLFERKPDLKANPPLERIR